ncbi:hypothetical protein TrVE_jg8081 [Triparma verrucosa]|uniref:Uncharacterized protein n=1 Tax=Triparma verrucosa TaxID=1606542 RepID=A0A9W7F8M9_9STRA|nr:hypothetical protein TrVE_jg8081 [Triparma verrucosa]
MTTASSILSIFFLPVNLILYSNLAFGENTAKQIKWFEFGLSIAVVISAMFCGLFVAYKFEKAIEEEEEQRDEMNTGALDVEVVSPSATPTPVAGGKHKSSHHSSMELEQGEVSEDERDDRVATVVPITDKMKSQLTHANSFSEKITVIELASRFRGIAMGFGNICGIALIVFSGFVSNEKTPIWNREAKFFISVLVACFSGLALTLLITRFFKLTPPERVSITIECCYQNVGIATSIALNMYEGDDVIAATGVPLMYGVCECFLLTSFGVFAHYMDWTYANKKELSIVKAIFSVNQEENCQATEDANEAVAANGVVDNPAADMK